MNLMDRLFLGKIIKELILSEKSFPLLISRKVSLVFSIRRKRLKIHLKSINRLFMMGGVHYSEIEFDNLDKIIKALMLLYGINKKPNAAEMTAEEIRALLKRELSA